MIDLLACGLGGVLVLWILALSSAPPPSPAGKGMLFQAAVTDVPHIVNARILKPDPGAPSSCAAGTPLNPACAPADSKGCSTCNIGKTELSLCVQDDVGEYARRVLVFSEEVLDPFLVEIDVDQCRSNKSIHRFEVFSFSGKTKTEHLVLFQENVDQYVRKRLGGTDTAARKLRAIEALGIPPERSLILGSSSRLSQRQQSWCQSVDRRGASGELKLSATAPEPLRSLVRDDLLK